jgi:hypothetical protein
VGSILDPDNVILLSNIFKLSAQILNSAVFMLFLCFTENMVLRKIFGAKRDQATGKGRRSHVEEL